MTTTEGSMTSTNDEKHEFDEQDYETANVMDAAIAQGKRSQTLVAALSSSTPAPSGDYCKRMGDCGLCPNPSGNCTCTHHAPIEEATEPPAAIEASVPERKRGECFDCRQVMSNRGGVILDVVKLCPRHSAHDAEVARLREALRGAQATIESMRSENKLHGHITDASAFYLHHSKPLIDAALQEKEGIDASCS